VADRTDRTERPEQVDDPALIAAARHALHDEELVAAFAVDGDAADDPARARALIERCQTCREIYADVVSIGSTIRASGTSEAVGLARPAPRDFRLTPLQAARLQPGNVLQRAVARLRAGAAMFGRPVGATLATLGLVGLLVGSMGLGQLATGGAPQRESATIAGAATAGPGEASTEPVRGSTSGDFGAQAGASQATDGASSLQSPTVESPKDQGSALSSGTATGIGVSQLLFAGSILVLVAGLALLLAGQRHARAWQRAPERP
jgi:hypothetical protein